LKPWKKFRKMNTVLGSAKKSLKIPKRKEKRSFSLILSFGSDKCEAFMNTKIYNNIYMNKRKE